MSRHADNLLDPDTEAHVDLLRGHAFFFRPLAAAAQFIQLVVQGLQANPEDLGGARLVVARVLERHQDQPRLRLLHRRPRRQRQRRLHDIG